MDTVNYNAEAELFPPRPDPDAGASTKVRLVTSNSTLLPRLYDLRWKNSHRSCFSVPISRSMRTDLMAAPSGSFTRAMPIH